MRQPPPSFNVEITSADVQGAQKRSLDNCVLARAISRTTGRSWLVGHFACWPADENPRTAPAFRIKGLRTDIAWELDQGNWKAAKRSIGRTFRVEFWGFCGPESPLDPAISMGERTLTQAAEWNFRDAG